MTKAQLVALLAPYPDETSVMMIVGVQCEDDDIDSVTDVRPPTTREQDRVVPGEPCVVLTTRKLS